MAISGRSVKPHLTEYDRRTSGVTLHPALDGDGRLLRSASHGRNAALAYDMCLSRLVRGGSDARSGAAWVDHGLGEQFQRTAHLLVGQVAKAAHQQ